MNRLFLLMALTLANYREVPMMTAAPYTLSLP